MVEPNVEVQLPEGFAIGGAVLSLARELPQAVNVGVAA